MSNYRPSLPFSTPMHLLIPTYSKVKGVTVKRYTEPSEGNIIYGSFKSYGGTESQSNGVLTVLDTANIESWYRPDVKAECRIVLANDTTKVYEVMGEPENIDMRNQFIKFKVQRVTGGA